MIVAAVRPKRSPRGPKAARKPSADRAYRWNKTAAPHHVANRNSTWRQRINAENRAYSARDDARLQTQWHDDVVCGTRCQDWQGHRRVSAASPRQGDHSLPEKDP